MRTGNYLSANGFLPGEMEFANVNGLLKKDLLYYPPGRAVYMPYAGEDKARLDRGCFNRMLAYAKERRLKTRGYILAQQRMILEDPKTGERKRYLECYMPLEE